MIGAAIVRVLLLACPIAAGEESQLFRDGCSGSKYQGDDPDGVAVCTSVCGRMETQQ